MYPTTLDEFTPHVDGVDDVMAIDVNELQTALEAIEAKLGIDSSAVASSHDYKINVLETNNTNTNTGDETVTTIKSKLGITTLSGSNTGDQTTVSGNAGSATVLQTARTINGTSFNGSADITVADTTKLPLAGGTMTGDITLGENASIALDPAGSADGKYSGITVSGTAGATLAFGDLIYLAVATSKWVLTDADATATAGTPMIGMCVLAANDTQTTKILLMGIIRADAKFPALTISAPAYVGETAGAIQVAIPTGADNVIRVVGRAMTADELYFNPSQDHQISVA